MKKLIFIFLSLFSIGINAQTANGTETKVNYTSRMMNPQTVTSATGLATMGSDGTVGRIDPLLLPVPTTVFDALKLKEYLSTGLLKNGLITINADPTKFNVSAGIGIISNFDDPENPVSSLVSFPAFTGVTPTYLLTGNITYIAISSTPAVVMQATPFTSIQRRDLIVLGAVIHSNLTNINVVNNISAPSNAVGNQLHDFIEAVGALNITGNKYTANGANLSLNKSAGTIFKFGVNFATNWKEPHQLAQGSGTALTFRYRTQNGTEGSDVTVINPAFYDLSNVLTAVPNNKFTIQTVVMFQTGLTRILYGQQVYDDLATAKNAIFTRSFNMELNSKENGIIRAYIVLKNNTTSLLNASDCEIIEAQKFGGVASGGVALTLANIVTALGYTPANDADVLHKTLDEIKNGKLGLNATILDSNVSDFKIGSKVPTDDNNIMAISKDYSAGNQIYNGLNIEIKSTSTVDNDVRVNRALKAVSLVDPNGFILSNQGGSGIGVEGVSRLQGLGTVKTLTGGYFRVLQDTDNPLAVLEVANGVVIPTPGGFSTAPIGTSIGININEHNYLSRSTNSINAFIGSPNLGGLLPVGLAGRYSIYNMSDEQNYFKYRLGLGITVPTEMIDVVGNGKVSGNIGVGTVSTIARINLSGSITGATTAYGVFNQPQIQSDVTGIAYYNRTSASTQAMSFTLSTLIHNSATQGTFGAGSIVTNQYGFIAASSLTGATNNYGFRGQIPSNASANWNTYNDGTAPNYFNGNVGIGTLPAVSATNKLQVNGNVTANVATESNHVIVKSQFDSSDAGNVKLSGNQSFLTGIKTINNISATPTRFIFNTDNTATGYALTSVTGSATYPGIFAGNNGAGSKAVEVSTIAGADALYLRSNQTGSGGTASSLLLIDNIATGNDITPIRIKKEGVEVAKIDYLGNATVNNITLNSVLKLKAYTVGTLPAGTVGDMAYVTDALAPAYNVTVAGGGAIRVPVFYNGTNWTAH